MNVRISSHQPQEFLVVVVHFAIVVQLPFLPEWPGSKWKAQNFEFLLVSLSICYLVTQQLQNCSRSPTSIAVPCPRQSSRSWRRGTSSAAGPASCDPRSLGTPPNLPDKVSLSSHFNSQLLAKFQPVILKCREDLCDDDPRDERGEDGDGRRVRRPLRGLLQPQGHRRLGDPEGVPGNWPALPWHLYLKYHKWTYSWWDGFKWYYRRKLTEVVLWVNWSKQKIQDHL